MLPTKKSPQTYVSVPHPRVRRALVGTSWISGHIRSEQVDIYGQAHWWFRARCVCTGVVGVWKWKVFSPTIDGWASPSQKKTSADVSGQTTPTHHCTRSVTRACMSVRFCGRTHRTKTQSRAHGAVQVISTPCPKSTEMTSVVWFSLCLKLQIERHRNIDGVMRCRTSRLRTSASYLSSRT